MATPTTKPAPVKQTNGGASVIEAIEPNVKAIETNVKAIETNVKAAGDLAIEANEPNVKAIETNVKAAGDLAIEAIETNVKAIETNVKAASGAAIEAIGTNIKAVEDAAVKAVEAQPEWLRQLPLAGLGLVATIYDETEVFVSKLFMHKLVKRGELVQKNAEKWLKDLQARFR
jgi:hypothetical protein